jgi:uncharacterized cupin superfamily protein
MNSSNTLRLGTALLAALAVGYFCVAARADVSMTDVPHGRLENFNWVSLPQTVGSSEAIIYRSPDGKRVAVAFKESGKGTFTYPFDEFSYVISGSIKITVHGGPTFEAKQGEVAYIRKGQTIDFEFSKGFQSVAYLVSDEDLGKWAAIGHRAGEVVPETGSVQGQIGLEKAAIGTLPGRGT